MSQTFYKKGFLALAVATALGVSAFAQADIKIGVAGPMTGANAAFGEQYMKGAQAAADAVNAAGGVNGEKIVLVKGDDACEPKQAVTVAKDLTNQKVAGVVGHFCSSYHPGVRDLRRSGHHRHHSRLDQPTGYRTRPERHVPYVRS